MAIGYNDPVVVMVIRRNPWPSYTLSPLFPFDVWQPASVLVRGQYDDYGNVALDEDARAAWRLTQKQAQRWYEKVWIEAHKDDRGRDWPGRWHMQDVTLPYTFDDTGERADIGHSSSDEEPEKVFTLWMAHAGIFDYLCDHVQLEWFNNGSASFSDKPVREVSDHLLANARKLMEGEVPTDYQSLAEKLGEGAAGLKRALRWTRNPWKTGSSTESNPVSDFFEEAVWDAHDDGDTARYDMLCQHWHTNSMLSLMLYQMRKSVCPPGTIGPQHGHDQPFLALAAAITEQAARNRAKYDEDFDEESDDGAEAAS
jgi:hypothetical protein